MSRFSFDYRLKRSARRRTIGIRVAPDGVTVSVPSQLDQQEIDRVLRRKAGWIEQKLALFKQAGPLLEKQYIDGEPFDYLGRPLKLRILPASRGEVERIGEQLIVRLRRQADPTRQQAAVQRLLEQWYRQQALRLLDEKSRTLAARIGRPVGQVRVRRTRSKWGHCTHRGDLQYNWLILAAPEPVIDYLVAHEVSHLVHPNHSAAFWQQVETLCPDWKAQRDWLKRHGHTLVV
ncbi:M48 family metallopeptidase [Marinobacterium arenosum]|uniref:M48 family metallopeptidase n=1 Tax=Marinobacterium arenosum TaxID=2862496 RepID=UPI001C976737|nr:SprT family zinc-dependent metalloprotease [Marinobacterium arenosum]MBY4677550.1 M48 family metallopeptidase [Marinobacterium arenosum]